MRLSLLSCSRRRFAPNYLVWIDPSDISTLYQDAAGTTPVTTPGHAVGKIIDKSRNGNHAYPVAAVYAVTSDGYGYIKYTGSTGSIGIDFGWTPSSNGTVLICPPERIGSQAIVGIPIPAIPKVNMAHGQIIMIDRAITEDEELALNDMANNPETFDYYPDVQDATNATSTWKNTTTTATVSDITLTGDKSYTTFAQGADGLLYGIPFSATTIAIINPMDDSLTYTNMGANLSGSSKWWGHVVVGSKIYGIPHNSKDILVIDTDYGTATRTEMGAGISSTFPSTNALWCGGSAAINGKIYCTSYNAQKILIIDTTNGTATISTMGLTPTMRINGYKGSVTHPDGYVYHIAHTDRYIIRINPTTGVATYRYDIGALNNYNGGVLLPDGRIAMFPQNEATVGVYTPSSNSYATYGSLGATSDKCRGGFLGLDGKAYGIPNKLSSFVVFDPATNGVSTSTLGYGGTLTNSMGATQSHNGYAYVGGFTNGKVLKVRTYGTGGGASLSLSPYMNKL